MLEEDPQGLQYSVEPDANLLAILNTRTAEHWFAAIVSFACDLGENFALHRAQLHRLSDEDCLHLYHQFTEHEHLSLLQSLYRLKSKPVDTANQQVDSLSSRSNKLILLYLFVHIMHKTLVQILSQRGFNPIYDCLFHDSEKASPNESHELFFNELIDEWQLIQLIMPEETVFRQKLTELLGAYKYWFNPDLLIDRVMKLKRVVEPSFDFSAFRQHLKLLYQQITTTECFDLYGYFSNKDTRYLMRTLYAAQQGLSIRGLEPLNNQEKDSIDMVYQSLDCLMESLLDELRSRHFTVQSYENNRDKAIKPRHRILKAIKRILFIYKSDIQPANEKISQLFTQLEA